MLDIIIFVCPTYLLFFDVKGFCHAMKALLRIGLLDPNPRASLHPSGPDITWVIQLCNSGESIVRFSNVFENLSCS